MVGPKKQDFWPWINKLNGKKMKKEKKSVRQKIAKIVPSKLIFDVKNGKHEKNPKK